MIFNAIVSRNMKKSSNNFLKKEKKVQNFQYIVLCLDIYDVLTSNIVSSILTGFPSSTRRVLCCCRMGGL